MATNDNDHWVTCPKWSYQVVFVHFGLPQIYWVHPIWLGQLFIPIKSNTTNYTWIAWCLHGGVSAYNGVTHLCSLKYIVTCNMLCVHDLNHWECCFAYLCAKCVYLFPSFHLNLCDKKVIFFKFAIVQPLPKPTTNKMKM